MPKSMKECSEKRPELDQDLILLDIGKITTQVELGCTSGGDLFAPDQVKYYSEVSEYGIQGTFGVCLGLDRASLSLYTPLEGLETTFAIFSNAVMDFGDRARYMEQKSIPSINGILTDISYLGHERACRKIRSVLDKTGEIDGFFVNSFKSFAAWLKEPIIALQTLIDFLESVCRGGSELVAPTGSDPATPSASAQNVVSLGAIMHPAGPVGHARTSSTASERGGVSTVYDDLKAAATAGATSPRYSPFPSPDPMQIPEHPPLSPSFFDIDTDTDTHAHPTTAHPTTTTTANTGIIDPSTHTHIHNPEPALRALPTPTNPSWKLALSNRHPLHTLFVGTHELQVFARCLYLAQKAMVKAEECISVIEECRYLAIRMEKEWAMWDESCTEMREALDQKKVDEGEAGGEGLEQRGNADGWWGEGCGGEKGWVGK